MGVIFKEPLSEEWQTADEYLSGNVREKLAVAKSAVESSPEYEVNAKALEAVMPKDLEASEIEVRIGATWIKPEYVDQFMRETFKTPEYLTRSYGLGGATVGVQYSAVTGVWNVKGKNADRANPIANSTYGTMRANAYKILEDSLNLKDSRVYDTVLEEGKEKRVLNKKETTLASQKQEAIREAFKDWIFAAPERRADLVETYNKLFNSIRPREYEGAHLTFPGMSPEVTLRPHQKNAVAHAVNVAVSYAGMIMIPGWFLIGAFVVGVIGFIVLCIFFFKKNPVELQVSGYKGRQLVTKEGYITMAVCLCVTGMLLMI